MIECIDESVRDALPDLLDERLGASDRAMLAAHLEGCGACRRELELLKEVRRTAPLAPTVNVARIVAALPAPVVGVAAFADKTMRQTPDTRRFSRSVWMTAGVAAVALVFGVLVMERREVGPGSRSVASSTSPSVEVDIPKAIASDPVAPVTEPAMTQRSEAQRSAEVVVASMPLAVGVQDLTDENLEVLIAELDAMDPLPAAEPEALLVDIENNEGGE